jgi:DNA replication protein DnaC
MRNSLDELFRKMLIAKLWIIDDWGVVTLQREVAEEIFDLFDRRKYSSAMILTSNRDIEEWPQVFPDPVIANATIDRIFDRAETLVFKGDSYRLKGKIQIREIDAGQIKH